MMYKKIHFVGVKGVGMTPLAILAKETGLSVSGSDVSDEFITDDVLLKAGIKPLVYFSKDHIKGADLVIATGAHGGFSNIEVKEAKKQGIEVITQGEAAGLFMKGSIFDRKFTGISIAGTHGKTTTTAMAATVLKAASLDPSYVIGTSFIPSLGFPGHLGKGKYFVAEADEYATEPTLDKRAKFLWQHPKIIVITNIEFDHPDVYSSLGKIRKEFLKFANQLPKDGVLIACGDDRGVRTLLQEFKGRKITYGFEKQNDYVVGRVFKNIALNVFGEHNKLNALAAYLVGLEVGLPKEQIQKGLERFKGSKRRSEFIGKLSSGAKLYDDYAHHPTEIKSTLKAFRENFPHKRIVCIFQPHTYSRTKSLFEQFTTAFNNANVVILTEIYASLREKKDKSISSKALALAIKNLHKQVVFFPKLSDVVKYLNQLRYGKDTVIITMGAGDIYKISEKLSIRPIRQAQGRQAQDEKIKS